MYCKSKRTGKYGEIMSMDDGGVYLEIQGLPTKKLSVKTFEQNFVEVPDEEGRNAIYGNKEENSMPTRSNANGTTETVKTPMAPAPETKDAKTGKATEKKPKGAGRPQVSGDHPLWNVCKNYVEQEMDERHTVGAEGKVKGFRSFKVDGHMFCNINYNKNGATLWVRQEAVKGISLPDGVVVKPIGHMFDGRVHFSDINPANIKAIQEILQASSKFQVDKKANTAKAIAERKRAEKAAAKAKAEEEKKAKEAKIPAPAAKDAAPAKPQGATASK